MNDKNIYQRIANVQELVSSVAKDTTVTLGNKSYKGVSHDAVLSVIRDAVIKSGIIISTSQVMKGESIPGQTNSGNYKHRFEAVYRVEFINIDNPEDRHAIEVEAHADDSGDKAPGKAISYATKTAELKIFLLATGENDEERMEDGSYESNLKQLPQLKPQKEREEINAGIVKALSILCGDNQEKKKEMLIDITTWDKNGETIYGKPDYRYYSDKQAKIVLKELNLRVDRLETQETIEDDFPF